MTEFVASGGRVTAVRTDAGDELPADLVVVGVGARPNIELARSWPASPSTTGSSPTAALQYLGPAHLRGR